MSFLQCLICCASSLPPSSQLLYVLSLWGLISFPGRRMGSGGEIVFGFQRFCQAAFPVSALFSTNCNLSHRPLHLADHSLGSCCSSQISTLKIPSPGPTQYGQSTKTTLGMPNNLLLHCLIFLLFRLQGRRICIQVF